MRLKYPLTADAKAEAHRLVRSWESGEIEQTIYLGRSSTLGDDRGHWTKGRGANETFTPPTLGIIYELAEYKLIRLEKLSQEGSDVHLELTLLQELRNAVQNDFEVSDFFLTTTAVGMIVQGDVTLEPYSNLQMGASVNGDVNNILQALPDQLTKILGENLLQDYPSVDQAIESLRTANPSNRRERLGLVIQELGRILQHLTNTAGAIQAIKLIMDIF